MLKKARILNWEVILVCNQNKFLSIIFLLICISLFSCNSESTKKDKPINTIDLVAKPRIENFFNILAKGQAEKAVLSLLESNSELSLNDSFVVKTVEELSNISLKHGSYVDYILLRERNVLDAIGVYVYLVRYEDIYYRFFFEFYNNSKKIIIYKFNMDNKVGVEIEESLKLYMSW